MDLYYSGTASNLALIMVKTRAWISKIEKSFPKNFLRFLFVYLFCKYIRCLWWVLILGQIRQNYYNFEHLNSRVDKRGRGTCRATWYVGTCRHVNRKMQKIYYTKRSNFVYNFMVRARTFCSELWYVHLFPSSFILRASRLFTSKEKLAAAGFDPSTILSKVDNLDHRTTVSC